MRRAAPALSPFSRTLLAVLGLGPLFFLPACEKAATEVAEGAPPPAVIVTTVARKDVTPTITFTGRIEAVDRVDLRARVKGFLDKRHFEEGTEVKIGDVLFTLEKADYVAEVARAKARVERAEATLKLARVEVDRQVELLRRQVAPQAKVDEAQAKFGETQADLNSSKAQLDQAQLELGYTEIAAPIAGQIGRSTYSSGAYLTPESDTLATIVSLDPIHVSFPVTQRELLAVRRRAVEEGLGRDALTVHVRLGDGSMYNHTGSISFVDVQVNRNADTVTVQATLPNPERLLIDGQLVSVEVGIAAPRSSIVIPQQAIQFDQTGYFVLVVDAESRVKVRRVTLGPGHEGDIEITGGIEPGERIITEGLQKVRPNAVVQVAEASEAGKPR